MTPESFRFTAAITLFIITLNLGNGEPHYESASIRVPAGNVIDRRTKNVTPMHKALLTQRGYIQFLRWDVPVPEIDEFTFCVWVKSTNLTYPHSIFSYSKNEMDRLVRAWISSQGLSVHLEIDNVEIFAHPAYIREHRWYHICESWNNADGRYALWIDGQKKIDGYATKMAGHVIPSNGDVVLGQEYTDFDKGLEEGVEGAVLGFNLILSSAFETTNHLFQRNKLNDVGVYDEADTIGYKDGFTVSNYDSRSYSRFTTEYPLFARIPLAVMEQSEIGSTNYRSSSIPMRILRDRSVKAEESRKKRKSQFSNDRRNENSAETKFIGEIPLGQQLVETSYENCEQGRGSPRIGGKLMIISWTRTPVKVFGGAIIKNAKSDCGSF